MGIDAKRAAVSLGGLFAVLHFIGVLLRVGTNGEIVKYVMELHHVRVLQMVFLPLDVGSLIIGTVLAAIVGGIVGWLFATIWNWAGKK